MGILALSATISTLSGSIDFSESNADNAEHSNDEEAKSSGAMFPVLRKLVTKVVFLCY